MMLTAQASEHAVNSKALFIIASYSSCYLTNNGSYFKELNWCLIHKTTLNLIYKVILICLLTFIRKKKKKSTGSVLFHTVIADGSSFPSDSSSWIFKEFFQFSILKYQSWSCCISNQSHKKIQSYMNTALFFLIFSKLNLKLCF